MSVLAHHRRKPGTIERYYICRNTQDHFTSFNVLIQHNKRIDREELFHALRQVVLKEPTLACNFFRLYGDDEAENGHNWEVRFIDQISFDDVVVYKSVDKFDGDVLEELNDVRFPMNVDKPLWRLLVLELPSGKQMLCASFDHSLADGLTGIQFHKDLTSAISSPQKESVEYIFRYDPDRIGGPDISPSVEDLTDLYICSIWYKLIRYFLTTLIYKFIARPFSFLHRKIFRHEFQPDFDLYPAYSHMPVQRCLKTKYKMLNFTPEQVTKILAFCKAQDITMTPFFNIVGLRLMDDTIFSEGSFSSKSMIAVNGRRYFKEFDKMFPYGVLLASLTIPLAPVKTDDKGTLVRLMKYMHNITAGAIRSRSIFKDVGMFSYVNLWKVLKQLFDKTQVRLPMLISNLGRVSNSTSGWTFEQAYFSLNTSTAYQVVFDMVSTLEGGLNLVCAYLPEFHEKMIIGPHGKPVNAMDELTNQVYQRALSFIDE